MSVGLARRWQTKHVFLSFLSVNYTGVFPYLGGVTGKQLWILVSLGTRDLNLDAPAGKQSQPRDSPSPAQKDFAKTAD